jgi:hypothetical protein
VTAPDLCVASGALNSWTTLRATRSRTLCPCGQDPRARETGRSRHRRSACRPRIRDTGRSIAPTRCSNAWLRIPHAHTASYCAWRICHVVGSSRLVVLPKIRAAACRPASRLMSVGTQKTSRYPCGVVCGAPTAPMTFRYPAVHPRRTLRCRRREHGAPQQIVGLGLFVCGSHLDARARVQPPRRRSRAGPSCGTSRSRDRAPTTPTAHRARAEPQLLPCDDHARDPLRMRRRREQGGRGADVRRDDMRPAEIGLSDKPGQKPAHRPRRQEILPAPGCAEPPGGRRRTGGPARQSASTRTMMFTSRSRSTRSLSSSTAARSRRRLRATGTRFSWAQELGMPAFASRAPAVTARGLFASSRVPGSASTSASARAARSADVATAI